MVLRRHTTTGKVALLAVAGTFIVFSLVVAMLVPRRRPEFPGRQVGTFVAVAIALFAVQLGTVFWVAETQEVEAAEHAEGETEPVETLPTETETAPTETETAPRNRDDGGRPRRRRRRPRTAPTETETDSAGGDAAAGKRSLRPRAAVPATALGRGNQRSRRPEPRRSSTFVRQGRRASHERVGPHAAVQDRLTEQQIRDVASVSETTRGS